MRNPQVKPGWRELAKHGKKREGGNRGGNSPLARTSGSVTPAPCSLGSRGRMVAKGPATLCFWTGRPISGSSALSQTWAPPGQRPQSQLCLGLVRSTVFLSSRALEPSATGPPPARELPGPSISINDTCVHRAGGPARHLCVTPRPVSRPPASLSLYLPYVRAEGAACFRPAALAPAQAPPPTSAPALGSGTTTT